VKSIRIGDKIVGEGQPVFFIAEAGINHDGKLSQALELVERAKEARADAVKFQTIKADSLCSKRSKNYELFKNLELRKSDWAKIAEKARNSGIMFFSSPFDEESVNLLDDLGVPAFKVASGDLTHLPLLKYIARRNKPIILSTGMSRLSEVDEALNTIYGEGNRDVVLLHCVVNYPTNARDANLKAIKTLEQAFALPVGFSDHSLGTLLSLAAVCLGARVIEKHFTLHNGLPGPDHKLSLNPAEFAAMVSDIRVVEQAFGDGIKVPRESELEAMKSGRRSITARMDIPAGATITPDMLKISRPGTGIEPKFLDLVIGKKAKAQIQEDEALTWSKI
jgi:N-acetylneuraminate synthase/N,N'-diacetyllegionaminate synthase